MKDSQAEFLFRVWVCPKDGEPPRVEVWFHGIEGSNGRYVSEWVREAMDNLRYEFHDLFELPPEGYWQVVGKATIRGWFDYLGEYDEAVYIIEYTKEKVDDP